MYNSTPTHFFSYVSNLKMNPAIGGFYECSVSSKTDGRYHRTRLRVTTKPGKILQVGLRQAEYNEVGMFFFSCPNSNHIWRSAMRSRKRRILPTRWHLLVSSWDESRFMQVRADDAFFGVKTKTGTSWVTHCRCPSNIHGEHCEYLSSDGPMGAVVCE